jgi:hypothetical protein
MGNRGTSEVPVDCPFFEELDKFLGKRHHIEPIAIASSIEGDTGKYISNKINSYLK